MLYYIYCLLYSITLSNNVYNVKAPTAASRKLLHRNRKYRCSARRHRSRAHLFSLPRIPRNECNQRSSINASCFIALEKIIQNSLSYRSIMTTLRYAFLQNLLHDKTIRYVHKLTFESVFLSE